MLQTLSICQDLLWQNEEHHLTSHKIAKSRPQIQSNSVTGGIQSFFLQGRTYSQNHIWSPCAEYFSSPDIWQMKPHHSKWTWSGSASKLESQSRLNHIQWQQIALYWYRDESIWCSTYITQWECGIPAEASIFLSLF